MQSLDSFRQRLPCGNPPSRACGAPPSQRGAGLLGIVAIIGVILMIVQGALFHQAKVSNKFLGSERNKLLSLQMAEAGIEENIADIGSRHTKVTAGMADFVTYQDRALGAGSFTTKLATVAIGASADTVDLISEGAVGSRRQKVTARLRLRKYLDTVFTVRDSLVVDSTYAYTARQVAISDTTIMDPNAMPPVNTTPAYNACIASPGNKCDVCHLPNGNLSLAVVVNISKPSINTHISHHGDYVTTDGTCDIYKPKITTRFEVRMDTVLTVVDHTVYDTTVSLDTAVKVQILSWK